jgi:hypothetical protein
MKYKAILSVLLGFVAVLVQAQDMERMKRDIEVTENILSSLLQEDYESGQATRLFFGASGAIEGSYIEDFGVLFTIAPRFRLGSVSLNSDKVYIGSGEGGVIVIPKDAGGEAEEESDSISEEQRFRRLVETFATDYAFLLRQVPPDEKIMIRYGAKGRSWNRRGSVIALSGTRTGGAYSAVIKKSDLDAFQEGRISQEQLRNRIEFVIAEEGTAPEDRDLEILTNIFSTLYKDRSGRTIGLRGTPEYEKIEGLGAIVYMTAGPRGTYFALSGTTLKYYSLEGLRQAPLPPEKEDKKDTLDLATELSNAFPGFLEELKQHIVEYGSIVRNLSEDEALIFRVDFFDCRDCEVLPEEVEITAKQPMLAAYKKGTIDLQTAVEQLKVITKE